MKKIISILLLSFIAFNVFAQDTTAPKGRPIDSIKIWKNGVVYFADDINVVCVYDDLNTEAKFYYELKDNGGEVVTNGNVTITGQRYKNYSTLANHADRAVVLVMQELKLAARAVKEARAATTSARTATSTTTTKKQ
jgi:uncharacterized membrane protein